MSRPDFSIFLFGIFTFSTSGITTAHTQITLSIHVRYGIHVMADLRSVAKLARSTSGRNQENMAAPRVLHKKFELGELVAVFARSTKQIACSQQHSGWCGPDRAMATKNFGELLLSKR